MVVWNCWDFLVSGDTSKQSVGKAAASRLQLRGRRGGRSRRRPAGGASAVWEWWRAAVAGGEGSKVGGAQRQAASPPSRHPTSALQDASGLPEAFPGLREQCVSLARFAICCAPASAYARCASYPPPPYESGLCRHAANHRCVQHEKRHARAGDSLSQAPSGAQDQEALRLRRSPLGLRGSTPREWHPPPSAVGILN